MSQPKYLAGEETSRGSTSKPRVGREQAKNRPGLVLTEREVQLGYRSDHRLPRDPHRATVWVAGQLVVDLDAGLRLVEQVKSLDWRARGAAFIERVASEVIDQVKKVLAAMLDMSV